MVIRKASIMPRRSYKARLLVVVGMEAIEDDIPSSHRDGWGSVAAQTQR